MILEIKLKLYLWNKKKHGCWDVEKYGYCWEFKWSDRVNGFTYETKKNMYKLFFGNQYRIGILRKVKKGDIISQANEECDYWFTYEKELQAVKLEMENGTFYFK